MASRSSVLSPDVAPILVSLAVLAAYSIAPALSYGRLSPPFFFTAALGMAAAALRPTLPVALAASASGIAAALLLVLDQIHGDCYYSVLAGKSWPRPGIQSDLAYYQRCTQSAHGFYFMVALSSLWTIASLLALARIVHTRTRRIKIHDSQDLAESTFRADGPSSVDGDDLPQPQP